MDGKFNSNLLICEQDDTDINNPESGPDSPSSMVNDMKMTSTSSPKRGKRGMHKRVVSIPIKDVEGSRLKGENAPPPSDSWAWRKYGQKPIKGSPYPRGYYRCSSSKGCPARKQVERSRVDPSMLLITYSCEHNHPWPPPSRNNHHHHHQHNNHPSHQDATPQLLPTTAAVKPEISSTAQAENPEPEPEPEPEEKFTNLSDESLITAGDEFSWFGYMETNSSTMLQSHIFTDRSTADADMAASLFFPMREEDESLFADLGELPECSAVFRHHRSGVGPEVQIC